MAGTPTCRLYLAVLSWRGRLTQDLEESSYISSIIFLPLENSLLQTGWNVSLGKVWTEADRVNGEGDAKPQDLFYYAKVSGISRLLADSTSLQCHLYFRRVFSVGVMLDKNSQSWYKNLFYGKAGEKTTCIYGHLQRCKKITSFSTSF